MMLKTYSQNAEDKLIHQYFGERTGNLLSLGENDGRTLSNALAAIERGWGGVLVEPSKTAYDKLFSLHHDRVRVFCYNVAIGEVDGEADFYESGEHLGTGDTSLISTLVPTEIDRWKGSKFDNFTKTKTKVVTWPTFYESLPIKKFELVSVDCEGLDLYILQQMDLSEMGCEMLIVEWNSKGFADFASIAERAGMKLYSKNRENLIFVK